MQAKLLCFIRQQIEVFFHLFVLKIKGTIDYVDTCCEPRWRLHTT